ncbi:MAG: hypothetical protein PWQ57_2062 [Desulfovibrionales bacterium]|nr:hypothetical protein [Desulfovibrionales bacterium]
MPVRWIAWIEEVFFVNIFLAPWCSASWRDPHARSLASHTGRALRKRSESFCLPGRGEFLSRHGFRTERGAAAQVAGCMLRIALHLCLFALANIVKIQLIQYIIFLLTVAGEFSQNRSDCANILTRIAPDHVQLGNVRQIIVQCNWAYGFE